MSYRGLILDFGGVLTTDQVACALSFERREGLEPGAFVRAISSGQGAVLYEDLERGAISQTQWNEATGALLGVDGTDLLRRVLKDLHPEPSVLAAAQAARRAGIRVGILSNSLGMDPYDPYEGYGFETDFDAVVISELVRLRKPDPEIYRVALERMGLPGSQCVFVDDIPRNLPPAAELGMATVLAEGPAKTIAQLEGLLGVPLSGVV